MTTTTPLPRLMRLRLVERETGLSRPTIYRLAAAGAFPKPRSLGAKSSAWLGEEIQQWIDSRPISSIAAPSSRVAA